MQLDISDNSLPVYKALANPMRLKIIQILSHEKLNVRDIAAHLGISTTITLKHLQILADAGIIAFEKDGHNKISMLKVDNISVRFPNEFIHLLIFTKLTFPWVIILTSPSNHLVV